ncbi:hypothetical protein KI387_030712, partial [Taxus chinensis]
GSNATLRVHTTTNLATCLSKKGRLWPNRGLLILESSDPAAAKREDSGIDMWKRRSVSRLT